MSIFPCIVQKSAMMLFFASSQLLASFAMSYVIHPGESSNELGKHGFLSATNTEYATNGCLINNVYLRMKK